MTCSLIEVRNQLGSPVGYKRLSLIQFLFPMALVFFFTLGIFRIESNAASPQMVKEAQKEGKVVYYTTVTVQQADKLMAAFKNKYPGIKAEYFRASKEKLLTRLLAEDSANRTVADVVSVNDIVMHLLRLKEVLGKYDNTEASAYGPELKDRDGYWTGFYGMSAVIVYNTKMVKPEDVPKRYEDLLDTRWKGKMGMDGSKYEWFAAQLQNMGRENGLAFMKKLASQNVQFRTGITLLTQLTVAGEFPLIVWAWAHSVEEMIAQGAPIAWIPIQPVFMLLSGVGLTARAPHPNAARLLVEFLTSKEGQTVISNLHRIPARPDVPSDPPRLTKGIKFFTMEPEVAEKYQEDEQLFFRTFGLKR